MVNFGRILAFISGSVIGLYQWGMMIDWLSEIFGSIIAFWLSSMLMPSIIIFPFLHRWIEGAWPSTTYLALFAVMYGGVILSIAANRLTGELDEY